MPQREADSAYAWWRLVATLGLMTVGSSAMYVVAVVLPAVQAEFAVGRSEASIPYTMLMIGFGFGGILMGRLADRFGVTVPLFIGAAGLGLGFLAAAMAPNIWLFALAHGIGMGLFGCSATFAPLVADTSLWFVRRRGIAVGICASGNYLAGAVWPPIVQHLVETSGWRTAYGVLAVVCAVTLPLLALALRPRPPTAVAGAAAQGPASADSSSSALAQRSGQPFGLSMGQAQALLCVAGLACCVAMSMPQVHIVAYCGDLGYGAARGAQMAFGVVSRLISGLICDRIGGLRTLLLGSVLQGVALLLFIPFDSMTSLFIISAMFGLFQGGIVPSYAIIVREYFPPAEAGARVGTVLMFTMLGMALGGWMSGQVFDWTGSYTAAFVNGLAWNLLNLTIVITLWRRSLRLKATTAG
jgi:MFS family permease